MTENKFYEVICMVRNENNRLTEEGLRWSNIIEEDISENISSKRYVMKLAMCHNPPFYLEGQ